MAFSLFRKREDTFDYVIERTCKNCGQVFQGRFCNRCGEKVIDREDRSFSKMAESILNAFTFLEGKFWRSFKMMLASPGQLSANIRDGVQVPYMKLVGLFFVANFFYFLFPVFDSYNSTLYTQMNSLTLGNHSMRVTQVVEEHLRQKNISFEEFAREYTDKSTNLSKLFIVVLVFALAFVLFVLNFSRGNYFFEHVLFAFEFYSFQLLFIAVALANAFRLIVSGMATIGWNLAFLLSDSVFSTVTFAVLSYFVYRGLRSFYGQKWYWTAVKDILVLAGLQLTVELYRRLLFYLTMWLM